MTTRPSRSASIPIPRSTSSLSPSRNIESVISIPFAAPGRPRLSSAQAFPHRSNAADDHRGLGVSYGTRGSTNTAAAYSPTRPTARSMTLAAGPGRGSVRAPSTFEPRVVRASGEASRSTDTACLPSTSPSRTRRQSISGVRGTSAQRPISTYNTPPPPPVSFARPAYLEHSAFRHMLQTESPPALPPSRKNEPTYEHHGYPAAMSPPTDSDDESNVSPPRELPSAPPSIVSHDQILKLPTRWSDQYRHALLSVSGDGRDLTYHGASCSGDRDAAAARTINPIPSACGIYYYEVEIISKGQKGHISIGFAARDVKLSRLPGWETNSWGYHGDDGCSFAAEKSGTQYGPTFGTGDIIGCGIDFTTYRAFFTKNGTLIGPVFEGIGKDVDVYPSVGMRHQGEAIRVNFGHEPFKYDIDYHAQQQQNQVWTNVLNTPLDSSLLDVCSPNRDVTTALRTSSAKTPLSEEQTKDVINQLVVSYLEHHGYVKTMRTFQNRHEDVGLPPQSLDAVQPATDDHDVDMSGEATLQAPVTHADTIEDDVERRTKIVKAVIAGDIDTALADTTSYHPTVLAAEEGLMLFKLRCRKFVELILEASELKKKMRSRTGSGYGGGSGSGISMARDESPVIEEMDGIDEDGMDVDDEGAGPSSPLPFATNGVASASTAGPISIPVRGNRRRSSASPADVGEVGLVGTAAQYETALHQAIAYGQTLSSDYKDDSRPEVRQLFKRTFAIVAWEDPMTAGGIVTEVVGHEARVTLANELNQAILKSQGRPTSPVLETLYRQTAACIMQLGMLGVGSAAFADMPKEFLEG
ncbi:Ran-binding protein 9 [Hypsizygus marmoreus]|uniref:Ran-binding protein 9 n=1 Tax=Hypsizygus marmoreus TaxID=39966 RepID=A0A369K9Q2_HYPMA|nr:Ran-binding protein 9 [Hypsizygus marmoreus]